MNYFYCWILMGILALGFHLLTKEKESDFQRELLYMVNPEQKKFSYRLLYNFVAPAIVSLLIIIAWPIPIYMKMKERFSAGNNKSNSDTVGEFSIKNEYLLERLSIYEIELKERIEDPLKGVPNLPFGHLHQEWKRFLSNLTEESEIWSYSAQWKNRWGQEELRKGYVILKDGKPEDYLMNFWKAFNNQD